MGQSQQVYQNMLAMQNSQDKDEAQEPQQPSQTPPDGQQPQAESGGPAETQQPQEAEEAQQPAAGGTYSQC